MHHDAVTLARQLRAGDLTPVWVPDAPVGLDPLARWRWPQRGRDHDAVVTQSTDLAVKLIPRRARFIAEIKLLVAAG